MKFPTMLGGLSLYIIFFSPAVQKEGTFEYFKLSSDRVYKGFSFTDMLMHINFCRH